MEAKVLAICDGEKQYAIKLMEAFGEKKGLGFQIHAFSDAGELRQFANRTKIEILLITGKLLSEEADCLSAGEIILLSDGKVYEQFSNYKTVYKYQSAEQIWKEILGYYADYAAPVAGIYSGKKEFEVHAVYSPIGRCGKSTLAKVLAKHFGKSKKTLLLDLQSYGASPEQLGEDVLWDLSDIIYFLREGRKTFLYKLGSIVQSKNGYDYVLPMKSPADIRSVTPAEWTELLEKLAADSDYQIIVMDFGYDVCGLLQLLSQCTRVYIPTLPDPDSQRKMSNFEWIVENENFKKVLDDAQKIALPSKVGHLEVKAYFEEWTERNVFV